MKRFLFILFIAVAFMLTQTTLNTDYSAFAKADKTDTKEKKAKEKKPKKKEVKKKHETKKEEKAEKKEAEKEKKIKIKINVKNQ